MSAPLLASETVGEIYQFARLQAMSQWWHWLVLLAVCAAILTHVVFVYRRDGVELSRALRWTLLALRVVALVGVLFYFLDLERRTERKLVKNSRALLLVDTSQSMGLPDLPQSGDSTQPTRIERVIREFSQGQLLENLRARHDVVVYRFDQQSRPTEVATFTRTAREKEVRDLSRSEAYRQAVHEARRAAAAAGVCLFIGVFFGLVYVIVIRRANGPGASSWTLPACTFLLIAGLVVLAVGNLRNPQVSLPVTLGWREPGQVEDAVPRRQQPEDEPREQDPKEIDWATELAARGLRTRLGDALRYVINKERGGPVAGIALFTDGRENDGVEYKVAVSLARLAEFPVYVVGLGSDKRPPNVQVVDLKAPERVYPEDRFTLTGFIQSNGLRGRTVEVKLTSAPTGAGEGEQVEILEQEARVELGDEEKMVAVKFDVTPDEPGRRAYRLSIRPPAGDANPDDNSRTANVEVVQRRTRVLLIAGGPSREFRFLRNQLYRDQDVVSDVWLQSGKPGMSQEADSLLFGFPESPDELFEYDCILAFDPDWSQLDLVQTKNLERWVADKAGGLVVVAGPVQTPQWADARRSDSRFNIIRTLYPVVLYTSGSATLGLGRFGGTDAWPLLFTRDGLEAEFLWLEDDAISSEAAWSSFEGVYGYYAVRDPKPGARVFARFSDPDTAISDGDPSTLLEDELPIYMAAHFYGAGRVFFQASGEMWRIRALDEAYFERYYTKLIRWISQGRLLQNSARGVLLVDKDRCLLGESVGVQAILTNAQDRPLDMPEVTANLVQPDGRRATMTLKSVEGGARKGTFAGQFTAVREGDYRVQLKPPDGDVDEMLVREVRVRGEEKEIRQPERNDPLLLDIAQKTGGEYFVGMDAAVGPQVGQSPLASALGTQDHVAYLPGLPDARFARHLMGWLMALICGALSMEWLFRRLSKLA